MRKWGRKLPYTSAPGGIVGPLTWGALPGDELSYSVTHFSYLLHEFGDLADRQHVRPLEARIGANHPVELSQLTNARCTHLVEMNSTLTGDDGERIATLASGLNIIRADAGTVPHFVGKLDRVIVPPRVWFRGPWSECQVYIGVSFLGGWFYVTCGGACVWCTYPDYWLSGSHVVWCWDRTGAHILSEHRPTCTVHAPHNQHPHAEHPTHQRHRVFAHPHLHSSPTHLIDQVEAAATYVCCALEDTCNTSHATCSLLAGSTQMVLKPTRPDS